MSSDASDRLVGSVANAAIGFSRTQLKRLSGKLDTARIHIREIDGKSLSYIEGWYAVVQANRIFGYQGWDRETAHFERIYEKMRGEIATCGYMARVRVRVRAGNTVILREGTGCGWASDRNIGTAHEKALKTAETDATKRALSTFGNQFGLSLYDKDQNGSAGQRKPAFTLFDPDGKALNDSFCPESFCGGLRQLIQACGTIDQIDQLDRSNAVSLSELRAFAPTLCNRDGIHFADLLQRLMASARRRLGAQVAAPQQAIRQPQ